MSKNRKPAARKRGADPHAIADAYYALLDCAREAVGRYNDKLDVKRYANAVGFISFNLLRRMRDALKVLDPGVVPRNAANGRFGKEPVEPVRGKRGRQ